MIVYTDGSAHPNPGPGGFGCVFLDNNYQFLYTYSKQYSNVTNNRMEMLSILFAALWAKRCGESAVTIYSDSSYAINSFSKWMYGWEKNGWTKSNGGTLENLDIIKEYYNISKTIKITFEKVSGHTGIKYNELADKLATGTIKPNLNF